MDHGPGARAGRAGLRPLPVQPPAHPRGREDAARGAAGVGRAVVRADRPPRLRADLPLSPSLLPAVSAARARPRIRPRRHVRRGVPGAGERSRPLVRSAARPPGAAGRRRPSCCRASGVVRRPRPTGVRARVRLRGGDPSFRLDIKPRSCLRDGFRTPAVALWRSARAAFSGHFGGNGIHFPLLVVAIVLVVVVCRRWPLSYGAYAAVTLVVALSAHRLGSVERYCFSTFPFVLGIVSLTRSRRVELGVLVASGACMAGLATLALL